MRNRHLGYRIASHVQPARGEGSSPKHAAQAQAASNRAAISVPRLSANEITSKRSPLL